MQRNFGIRNHDLDGVANWSYLRVIICGFAIAIVVLALWTIFAFAHETYPPLCCNGTSVGGDCRPVACDSITETKDGYVWDGVKFTGDMVHASFDERCHACVGVYNDIPVPHCIFVQPTT